MLKAFNTLVKPSQVRLEKTLNIKKIEVKYIPRIMTSRYRSVLVKNHKITKVTLQFDPMGYEAFKESRQV